MVLATNNVPKQLLLLSFIGTVRPEEIKLARENILELLAELKPGFRLLSDLTQLESFAPDCAEEIGRNMKLFSDKGVDVVLRVIPDSTKDFGLNILSFFHYANHPRTITCDTMLEAANALSL